MKKETSIDELLDDHIIPAMNSGNKHVLITRKRHYPFFKAPLVPFQENLERLQRSGFSVRKKWLDIYEISWKN